MIRQLAFQDIVNYFVALLPAEQQQELAKLRGKSVEELMTASIQGEGGLDEEVILILNHLYWGQRVYLSYRERLEAGSSDDLLAKLDNIPTTG